ncbi:SPX domain-containing protein [Mucor velutinosus]|uniref:SPX domain-containing protein n=1 Tax=Mucor velutinosus TaxID=708070 RepID=A0AAN7DBF5_9FUNG|nr:SPX domain-containing protein [Mucor velutinosus]
MRNSAIFAIAVLTFSMNCFHLVSATKKQTYSQRTTLREIKRQSSGNPGSELNGSGGMSSASGSSESATMQTGPGPK